jgi:ER-derived vesicles protein
MFKQAQSPMNMNARIQPPNASQPTMSSPLDGLKQYTSKAEDILESVMDPIKPYLPAFGRFLIVVTFLEDALRIITQFGDQIYYLTTYRPLMVWGVAHLFLILNVCVCSSHYNSNSGNDTRKPHGHCEETL